MEYLRFVDSLQYVSPDAVAELKARVTSWSEKEVERERQEKEMLREIPAGMERKEKEKGLRYKEEVGELLFEISIGLGSP